MHDSCRDEIDLVVSEVLGEMIDTIVLEEKEIEKGTDEYKKTPRPIQSHPEPECSSEKWSLMKFICGEPSKCAPFDPAETTTMESKYSVHPNIAEFWCFITSFFYGSCLLLYFIKRDDWFEDWRIAGEWPGFIHFSMLCSVLVMICSAVYHFTLFEVVGCVDCFLASYIIASVTMSMFGIDVLTQIVGLIGLGVLNLLMWRYSTRIALIVVGFVYPFATLSCMRMKDYCGVVVFSLITSGLLCFLLDRMGYAPLHSVWHVLGGVAIAVSLYHVVVNGPLAM